MKRTIAMLLCVLMLASLFVGCSKQEAPATDTHTALLYHILQHAEYTF